MILYGKNDRDIILEKGQFDCEAIINMDGKEVKTNLWTAICDILGVEPWSEMIVIDKESMRNVGNE